MNGKCISRIRVLLALSALTLLCQPANAMLDPSGVYCESLGYKFIVEKTSEGYKGYCQISPAQKVDSWKFIKGEVAKDDAACAKKGYTMRIIKDDARCWYSDNGECATCVMADGSEVEVTKLLNLSFLESTCGDGTCGMPETQKTCPADCPPGGADTICDGVKDGICDPDCTIQNRTLQDPDCSAPTTTTTIKPAATTTTVKVTTTVAPKATLPDTKPLEPLQTPEDKGCWPLLLAPLSLLAAALGRALRVL